MCTNLKRSVRSIFSAHLRGPALSLSLSPRDKNWIITFSKRNLVRRENSSDRRVSERRTRRPDASCGGFVPWKTFSMRKKRCRPFWSKRRAQQKPLPLWMRPNRRVACVTQHKRLFTVLLYCGPTIAAQDGGQIRARVEEECVCVLLTGFKQTPCTEPDHYLELSNKTCLQNKTYLLRLAFFLICWSIWNARNAKWEELI